MYLYGKSKFDNFLIDVPSSMLSSDMVLYSVVAVPDKTPQVRWKKYKNQRVSSTSWSKN